MRTLSLSNGDTMPMLGLGTFKSEPGEIYQVVRDALEIGYRHIDCAPIYSNQAEIGNAIKDSISSGTLTRGELWLTSKLWNDSHAPEAVKPALEKTLSELRVDALDLFLMHWPVAVKPGVFIPETADDLLPLADLPLESTWRAMEDLKDQGLCRHIGVSNFSTEKMTGLLNSARIRPEVNQIELHPYLQQSQMLEFCHKEGILVTAYSPLGSQDRPERLKVEGEPVLLQDPTIDAIAKTHCASTAQIVLSWHLHKDISVIPKSTNKGRLIQNLAAKEIALSCDELEQIRALDSHRRYYHGGAWTLDGSSYSYENLWDEEEKLD